MKKIFPVLIVAFFMVAFSPIESICQYPPHQGDVPQGSGHGPVGGSGSIGGGLLIFLAMGSGYAVKKYYHNTQTISKGRKPGN